MMSEIGFKELYERAKSKNNPRKISTFIEAGEVSAAILTEQGNVYTGVCIDTACSLGMCAERNAIANMITNGESKITKLVCCFSDGRLGSPCGACREYLMQHIYRFGQGRIASCKSPRWQGKEYMEITRAGCKANQVLQPAQVVSQAKSPS